ncbi:Z-ring formation inhibitor MciZ [Bacillus infantis]|uniref:Z-ring formation inhibitor MciZ n=1 Tax=Bacillus infantis TaxID=324767 RepID=UPI000B9B2A4E|nr:Z-ring formation inhibitor MciZ [Bacillus infantis]MCK6204548.1 Z-ring formation inhibitor MciZ [Bacillus infantis]OXT19229.1 Z-ring formation inhibitor MciZ [Bacillus sp. OG2]
MKIRVHSKGVILAGKAWEIREKLREYTVKHTLIKEWIDSAESAATPEKVRLRRIK